MENKCIGYKVDNCTNNIKYKKHKYCNNCYSRYYYQEVMTHNQKFKIARNKLIRDKKKYEKYRNEVIRAVLSENIY